MRKCIVSDERLPLLLAAQTRSQIRILSFATDLYLLEILYFIGYDKYYAREKIL